MSKENNNYLINKIIELRKAHGYSQAELARRIKINNTALSKIEKGKRGVSSDELNKIASVFDVSSDYLLGRNSNEVDHTKKPLDLDEAIKNHEIRTYQGRPLSKEDLELIKRILRK